MDTNTIDKPLPNAPDAERIILGAILLEEKLLKQTNELMPDDFYNPNYRTIFRVMRGLSKAGKEINPVLIGEKMKTGSLEAFGGVAAITNLTYGLPHFDGIESYVSIVSQKSAERQAVKILGNAKYQIENGDDANFVIQNALSELQTIVKSDNSNGNLFAVQTANMWMDEAKTRPVPKMLLVSFGFPANCAFCSQIPGRANLF